MDLSIIIVSYKVKEHLKNCLSSIHDICRDISCEVIVVDNNSADGTVEEIGKRFPWARIIENRENIGFARANNQAYIYCQGEYILLLNPDIIIKPGSVQKVLDFMDNRKEVGIAACRLMDEKGRVQKSIKRFPNIFENIAAVFCLDRLFFKHHWLQTYYRKEPFSIDYPAGAFMMIRREAVADEPYLLNSEFFMYAEEKDLALRLRRKDWRCYFVPQAEVVHLGGQSTNQMPEEMFLELQKSQAKFYHLHYRDLYARLLCFTWWLVLISGIVKSLPLFLSQQGRKKISMMWLAALKFPQYCRRIEDEYRRKNIQNCK